MRIRFMTVSAALRHVAGHPTPELLPASSVMRSFSSTSSRSIQNRIYDPIRTPPTFYDYLRSCSSSNTLLLALFATSACAPCRSITPLLTDLILQRRSIPSDKFASIAFTEAELDSSDESNGRMMDLGIEYAITSLPTLVGFGGRRAERITDRLIDTKVMADKVRMQQWLNEAMQTTDSSGSAGGGGGILGRIFD